MCGFMVSCVVLLSNSRKIGHSKWSRWNAVYFLKISTQLFLETFAMKANQKKIELEKVGFCALYQKVDYLWISEFFLYIDWANKPQGTNACFKWGFIPELHKEPSLKTLKIILWLCKIYDSYVGRKRSM